MTRSFRPCTTSHILGNTPELYGSTEATQWPNLYTKSETSLASTTTAYWIAGLCLMTDQDGIARVESGWEQAKHTCASRILKFVLAADVVLECHLCQLPDLAPFDLASLTADHPVHDQAP